MSIELRSPVFQSGQQIPTKYTASDEDISPPLQWERPPDGTESLALVVDDPDAPRGVFTHWLVYNLPADCRELPERFPRQDALGDGTRQGQNDFGQIGYAGPAPPPGAPHHYSFRLYALDTTLSVPPGSSKNELLSAMRDHVVDQGELTGIYRTEG